MTKFPTPKAVLPQVWLLGGTGTVGRHLAALLPRQRIGRLFTVSRRAAAGDGADHIAADLGQPGVLLPFRAGDRVINLTEATPPGTAVAAIRQGAVFIDTSASPAYVRALRRAARASEGGGYLVDCTGIAPGLTNMLAHRLADQAPQIRHIDIAVEIGLGKHAGPAATAWVLRSLAAAGRSGRFAFREGSRDRLAIAFPFIEAELLAAAFSDPGQTATSYLAIDPPWVTRLLTVLLRLKIAGVLSRHADRLARLALRLPAFGPESTRIVVRGVDADGAPTGSLRFTTGDQATATAAVIAATALAAPWPPSTGDRCLTAADILTLEQTLSILRSVLPGTRLEDSNGNGSTAGGRHAGNRQR